MTKIWNKLAWPAAAVYWAALATGSLLPGGSHAPLHWDASLSPELQDVLHLPAYAGLVVLVTAAWATRSRAGPLVITMIALVCVAFGAAMELAQSAIPGRTCSLKDGMVNAAGALLGILAVIGWRRLSVRRSARRAGVALPDPARREVRCSKASPAGVSGVPGHTGIREIR
jgi:VanZ family protein